MLVAVNTLNGKRYRRDNIWTYPKYVVCLKKRGTSYVKGRSRQNGDMSSWRKENGGKD